MTIKISQFLAGGEALVGDLVAAIRTVNGTLNDYKVDFPGTGIKDAAGHYLLRWFAGSGTPVNYVQFTSASSTNPALIAAAGGDDNVDLSLSGKGTGHGFFAGTGAFGMPVGTTAQEPVGFPGGMRYDTDTDFVRYWDIGLNAWVDIISGAAFDDATYITKTDETADLPNSQPLSAQITGFLHSTTVTGVILNRLMATASVSRIVIANDDGGLGNPTWDLAITAVTPGTYTNATLTVDAYGRLTNAANGTAPVTAVSATLPLVVTGTTTPTIAMQGLTGLAQGDLIYGDAVANTFARLTKDTNATRSLTNTGVNNAPLWAQVNLTNGVTGFLPIGNIVSTPGSPATQFLRGDGTWVVPTAGAGTVTSVGLTSTTLAVTGSPITTNGSFTVNLPGSVNGANLLINGNVQVRQRGNPILVPASTVAYTLDRWQFSTNANQACTITQNDAGVLSGQYYMVCARDPGQTGTGTLRLCESLTRDMCRGAAGNTVTFSFEAAIGANFSPTSGNITVTVYTGTGSTDISGINGSFAGSATVINTTQAIAPGSFTTYTFTSSAIGASVTQLAAQISWVPVGTAGASDSISFRNFKLEYGNLFTGFNNESFSDNLNKCQYFYCKSYNQSVAPGSSSFLGAPYFAWILTTSQKATFLTFPVTMRATPTIVTFGPTSGTSGVIEVGGVDRTSFSNDAGQNGTGIGTNDANAAASIAFQWTADAELV